MVKNIQHSKNVFLLMTTLILILVFMTSAFAAHTRTATIDPSIVGPSEVQVYTITVTHTGGDSIGFVSITRPTNNGGFSALECGAAPANWGLDSNTTTSCSYISSSPENYLSSSSLEFTLTATSGSNEGNYTFTVSTRDEQFVFVNSFPQVYVDATPPQFSEISVSPSTGFAAIGDTITVSLTETNSDDDHIFNTCTLNGEIASTSNNNDGTYEFDYTVSEGDAEGAITFSCEFEDVNGNTFTVTQAHENITQNDALIDSERPLLLTASANVSQVYGPSFDGQDINISFGFSEGIFASNFFVVFDGDDVNSGAFDNCQYNWVSGNQTLNLICTLDEAAGGEGDVDFALWNVADEAGNLANVTSPSSTNAWVQIGAYEEPYGGSWPRAYLGVFEYDFENPWVDVDYNDGTSNRQGPNTIGGLYVDFTDYGSGINSSTDYIQLRRNSDNFYWNGTGWNETISNTSQGQLSGAGKYDNGVSYTILAGALDNAGYSDTDSMTFTYDDVQPAVFTATFDQIGVTNANANAISFTFGDAEVSAYYEYTITSSGGGVPVTGWGTISGASQQLTGIDVSGLSDGILTLSVTLEDAAENTRTVNPADTILKDSTMPGVTTVVANISEISESSVGVDAFQVNVTFNKTMTNATSGTITFNPGVASTLTSCAGEWQLNNISYLYTCDVTDANVNAFDVDIIVGTGFSDLAGNSLEYTFEEYVEFSIDTVKPTATFVYPVDEATYGPIIWAGYANGTAADDLGSGVNTVEFSMQNGSSNLYWDGDVFDEVSQTFLPATYDGGDDTWYIIIDDANFSHGDVFHLALRVTDDFGNVNTFSGREFTWDSVAPSGYTVEIINNYINSNNETDFRFNITDAEVGATLNYTISSSGGGSVTGTYAISSVDQTFTGIDVSSLSDGTLTLTVYLTDAYLNEGADDTDTVTMDTVEPDTTTVQTFIGGVSRSTIVVADVGADNFSIVVTFDEAMAAVGSLTFDQDVSNTLTNCAGVWESTTVYNVTCDVVDDQEDIFGIDVNLNGFLDVAGNSLSSEDQDQDNLFNIDMGRPEVSSVSVNIATIAQASVGINAFDVNVTFNEPMNTGVSPTVVFTPVVGSTLTNCGGSWYNSTVFIYNCDVEDDNVVQADVAVNVTLGQDSSGNVMLQHNQAAVFDIDTVAPSISSTVLTPDAGVSVIADIITVQLTATGSETGLTNATVCTVNGISATFVEDGAGVYNLTYAVLEGQSDVAEGASTIICSVRDAAGNTVNVNSIAANTVSIDATRPTVQSVNANVSVITQSSVGTSAFNITVTFSEAMDSGIEPTLAFTPSVGTTLESCSGSWIDSDTAYAYICDIEDANVTVSDIAVNISGAFDIAGNNNNMTEELSVLDIDTVAPEADVLIGYNISESSVMNDVIIFSVNFTKTMDITVTPVIELSEDVSSTLSECIVTWNQTNNFIYRCNVSDANVEISGIAVNISGAEDSVGNVMEETEFEDALSVDTMLPYDVESEFVSDNTNAEWAKDGDTVTLNVTFREAVSVLELYIAEQDVSGDVVAVNATTFVVSYTLDSDTDAEGTVQFNITVQDTFGNRWTLDSDDEVDSVTADFTTPFATAEDKLTSVQKPSLQGTFSDNEVVETITVTVNGQTVTATAGMGTWSVAENVLNTLNIGTYVVTVNVTDMAGNWQTNTSELSIVERIYTFQRVVTQFPRYGTLISNYELGALSVWGEGFTLESLLNSSAGPTTQRLAASDVDVVYVYNGTAWTTIPSEDYDWDFNNYSSSYVGYYVFEIENSGLGKSIRHEEVYYEDEG
jgi:hypothetical protein